MAFRPLDSPFARHAATALWIGAALVGPLIWALLCAIWLYRAGGEVGFAIGFIGAPALWAIFVLVAFVLKPRWVSIAAALIGTAWATIVF